MILLCSTMLIAGWIIFGQAKSTVDKVWYDGENLILARGDQKNTLVRSQINYVAVTRKGAVLFHGPPSRVFVYLKTASRMGEVIIFKKNYWPSTVERIDGKIPLDHFVESYSPPPVSPGDKRAILFFKFIGIAWLLLIPALVLWAQLPNKSVRVFHSSENRLDYCEEIVDSAKKIRAIATECSFSSDCRVGTEDDICPTDQVIHECNSESGYFWNKAKYHRIYYDFRSNKNAPLPEQRCP